MRRRSLTNRSSARSVSGVYPPRRALLAVRIAPLPLRDCSSICRKNAIADHYPRGEGFGLLFAGCHAFTPLRRASMLPRQTKMLTPAAGENMPPSAPPQEAPHPDQMISQPWPNHFPPWGAMRLITPHHGFASRCAVASCTATMRRKRTQSAPLGKEKNSVGRNASEAPSLATELSRRPRTPNPRPFGILCKNMQNPFDDTEP
jgi:hypothetical protein